MINTTPTQNNTQQKSMNYLAFPRARRRGGCLAAGPRRCLMLSLTQEKNILSQKIIGGQSWEG